MRLFLGGAGHSLSHWHVLRGSRAGDVLSGGVLSLLPLWLLVMLSGQGLRVLFLDCGTDVLSGVLYAGSDAVLESLPMVIRTWPLLCVLVGAIGFLLLTRSLGIVVNHVACRTGIGHRALLILYRWWCGRGH